MGGYDLSKEIGDLLRRERERRGLTQDGFAAEAGTTQQRLSRIERAATAATTSAVQRLFEALGLRLRVTAVPLEDDDGIDGPAVTSEEEKVSLVEYCGFLLDSLAGIPYVLTGRVGAYLQGAPVPVSIVELAVADADLDRLGEVLTTVNCLRYDERWGLYCDYIIDPRRRGPLRWVAFDIEFTVEVEPVLSAAVTIQVGHRTLRVRSLAEIEARDPDLAEIMSGVRARLRRSGAAPVPG